MPKTYSADERERMKQAVIDGLSEGTPLSVLCKAQDMPAVRTVYDWEDADADFAASIARARDAGWDLLACQAMEVVDAEPVKVEGKIDSAAVQWAKNRAWVRLELLKKWDPKRYGEMIKHAAPDGVTPIDTGGAAEKIAGLLGKAVARLADRYSE